MSDLLRRYELVTAAAYKLHEAIWFYGENNVFPPGLADLPELDAILAEALSHVPAPNGGNMVRLFKERDAIVIQWDPGDYEGRVRVRASSPDGDVSDTILEHNVGYAALSFPKGEIADFHAQILSEPDGTILDEGNVEF